MQVSRTMHVDIPTDRVRDYLSDFGHAEEWDPGTVSCERLDDGPVRIGSAWRNVSRFLGRETELSYRLERLDPDRVTFRGTNKTATSTDDIHFLASGGGTSVRYDATIEFNGLAKLAGPFLTRSFEKVADKTKDQLTAALQRLGDQQSR